MNHISFYYFHKASLYGKKINHKYSLTIYFSHFIFSFPFFKKILFIHETHTMRGRDIGRGKNRLPLGSLMPDSIPGPWDHNLSQRQMLNHWAAQASQFPLLSSHVCSNDLLWRKAQWGQVGSALFALLWHQCPTLQSAWSASVSQGSCLSEIFHVVPTGPAFCTSARLLFPKLGSADSGAVILPQNH